MPQGPFRLSCSAAGAVFARNPKNVDACVLGTTGQTNTVQDHAKLKLAYDLTPTLRASYTLGIWRNEADRPSETFLRDAAGTPVSSGSSSTTVNIGGRAYVIGATDFAASKAALEHFAHGLSLKSNTRGRWDWGAAASLYHYHRDIVRSQAGTLTDQHGTGWNTLALKGIWRPDTAHVVEGGLQRDAFKLRTLVSSTHDWVSGAAGQAVSSFRGDTRLTSLWAQDAWRFAPDWKAVIGGRAEHWQAFGGAINGLAVPGGPRNESHFCRRTSV